VTTNLRSLTVDAYRARGGRGETLPGFGAVSGRGRVDVRFAADEDGELYLLTKSDGMIRKVTGAREIAATATTDAASAAPASAPASASAALTNPVPPTPASIAAGKVVYDLHCASCHGPEAQGAVRAGVAISIIEESGARQPPDLTDAQWDHGSTDGAIFTAIERGVPSTMMAGYDGRLGDQDLWHVVNYIRSLAR
jgi:mono/diheme cytochrome c family protein